MIDRFALWLPFTLLVFLALFTFWIEQSVREAGGREGIKGEGPDTIVENFQAISTDSAGVPRYRLTANKLMHYSSRRQTLLENPRLTHFHEKQGEMQITSNTASVTPDGEKVVFSGEVSLLRPAKAGKNELSMQTSRLEILTSKNEAFTDKPVVIQQPGVRITAAGLHLSANSRVLKLKGRVKAEYQNAHRA